MAEQKGKYAAALANIAVGSSASKEFSALLPQKPAPPKGKRSEPGWKQKAVLLKKVSITEANERLKRRGDKTDFSDLMQALLEAWLQTTD